MINYVTKNRDIVDAIALCSPELLQSLVIDQGYDINSPLSTESIYSFNRSTCGNDFVPAVEEIVALDTSFCSPFAYPLHLAILAIYRSAASYSSSKREQAFKTIQILIDNGADCNLGCNGLLILCVDKYKWALFTRKLPIHLAMTLKKYGGADKQMDDVITLLQKQ